MPATAAPDLVLEVWLFDDYTGTASGDRVQQCHRHSATILWPRDIWRRPAAILPSDSCVLARYGRHFLGARVPSALPSLIDARVTAGSRRRNS